MNASGEVNYDYLTLEGVFMASKFKYRTFRNAYGEMIFRLRSVKQSTIAPIEEKRKATEIFYKAKRSRRYLRQLFDQSESEVVSSSGPTTIAPSTTTTSNNNSNNNN